MKDYIVVTGGAGFVGSNLIDFFLKKTKYKIISIDDYSSGTKKNHIKNNRVIYKKGNTKNISQILKFNRNKINAIFHFGEFARIYQSFLKMNQCLESNSIGSHAVFNFCLTNNIKLIYSATSASLGNNGKDKNLSPYAFTKSKNLELLENLKNWFKMKYEVIYFYNIYGPNQICEGDMATVIGIFENHYKNKKSLPIVKPGTQSRKFTHIFDTVKVCYDAWKKNKCRHYSISSKKNFTIMEVAKLFNSRIRFLAPRKGERYASALTSLNLSNKVFKKFGNISLERYIKNFIEKN
ncbi:NAD-dependent epimerase/dehydratase family protein [Candidatus Pelagibacter sp. Uisw_134_02]|uniref:NAD-dependent epimerase/dehydratase family protein n=1 Tax=Candidatus Pelagibacter sp. Uisw_134_02 TaxID=3230990 RepID=UPI0039EBBA7E